MEKQPFFSIVIALYNKEKHIQDTLNSVLNQTFTNFEIIIVNDGSTDHSLKAAQLIKDSRIKIFSIQNQGVSFARNFGIQKATANLIAFLDADDIWYPHHLEDLKKLYTQYPNCGLYCKAYFKQDGNTNINSIYKNIPTDNNWLGIVEDYFYSSSINCIAWTSAVMIPKSILNKLNAFDEKITLGAGEDTDLWMRIALKYPVAFYNKVSAIHKLHTENRVSNSNTNNRKFINLDQYENIAKTNKSLKKYLDIHRYSIAIQYKLIGNNSKAKEYIKKIDTNSLNKRQNLLLKLNTYLLKVLFLFKRVLKTFNIYLSAYR